jgi:hypothetical protein
VARWIRDQPTPAPAPVIAPLLSPAPPPPHPRASRRRTVPPRPVAAPVVPTPRRSSRLAAMSCAPLPPSPTLLSHTVPIPNFSEPHIFCAASSCFSRAPSPLLSNWSNSTPLRVPPSLFLRSLGSPHCLSLPYTPSPSLGSAGALSADTILRPPADSTPVLNLDEAGKPLTFRTALAGPFGSQWAEGDGKS